MRTPLLVATLLTFSAPAHAETTLFQYRILNIAPEGDCHDLARQVGEKFEAVTGIAPETSRCVDIASDAFSLVLSYRAETEQPLISTYDASTSEGTHADLESCQADLADETAHFSQATGLEPVIASCSLMNGPDRPYIIRIDSFGNPAVRPRTAWTMVMDQPIDLTATELVDAVKQSLLDLGTDLRSVVMAANSFGDIYVRYYADARMQIDTVSMAEVRSEEQCQEQLALAALISHTRTTPALVTFCAMSMLGHYYVMGIHKDLPAGYAFSSAETFTSYRACMDDREAIIASYNTRGEEITGGLCSESTGNWRVRLFSL